MRPRRPRPQSNVALSIWLGAGAFLALILVVIALQATHERPSAPGVEGSNADQQKEADLFRDTLAKDSTNVQARVGLANILFDTGNWTEAIVHYRSAVRQDSSLVPAIVDMGVCYYNLSDTGEAEKLFALALARDPHQPYALFNLGIVYERREDYNEALRYFHRAMESDPPEGMKQPLVDAMMNVQKKLGIKAPPLPDGSK
jgi:tetratricopeptide (TPR) repeat protein